LRWSVFREKEVFRFEVLMNNSGVVRGGQSTRHVDGAVAGLAQTHRTAAEEIAECFSAAVRSRCKDNHHAARCGRSK
jgi:hypothetical protein